MQKQLNAIAKMSLPTLFLSILRGQVSRLFPARIGGCCSSVRSDEVNVE